MVLDAQYQEINPGTCLSQKGPPLSNSFPHLQSVFETSLASRQLIKLQLSFFHQLLSSFFRGIIPLHFISHCQIGQFLPRTNEMLGDRMHCSGRGESSRIPADSFPSAQAKRSLWCVPRCLSVVSLRSKYRFF